MGKLSVAAKEQKSGRCVSGELKPWWGAAGGGGDGWDSLDQGSREALQVRPAKPEDAPMESAIKDFREKETRQQQGAVEGSGGRRDRLRSRHAASRDMDRRSGSLLVCMAAFWVLALIKRYKSEV